MPSRFGHPAASEPTRFSKSVNRLVQSSAIYPIAGEFPAFDPGNDNQYVQVRIEPGGLQVARITVEDCLKQVPNRFLLVNMVAKRVRQIREGSEYLVSSPKNEDIVVSLREVAAGRIRLKFEEEDTPPQLEEAVETTATEE